MRPIIENGQTLLDGDSYASSEELQCMTSSFESPAHVKQHIDA